MGQVVFALAFLILFFFYPKKIFWQGVILGFLFASKFWSVSLLYVAFLVFYRFLFLKERESIKSLPIVLLVAFLTFTSFYFKSFVSGMGFFDFLLLQARTLKFMLIHNSANTFGNLFLLFASGHYFSWWEDGTWVRAQYWSPLWPVSFLASVFLAFKFSRDKKVWFVFIFPIFYFLVNLANTAFTRYILFVIPFLYLSVSHGINLLINSKLKNQNSKVQVKS